MNVKANQHYQRTHRAIQEGVLAMLEDKTPGDITVTALCQTIGINRGTFYEHFRDIYDVLEKTEAEKAEDVRQLFRDGLCTSRRAAFTALFRYVRENRVFYDMYLQQGRELQLMQDVSIRDFRGPDPIVPSGQNPPSEAEQYYRAEFFQAGLRTLLRCWLNRDCQETPEELFDILSQQYQYIRPAAPPDVDEIS